ncbi:hypothetical protein [Shinella daejeonensis]|uniref:hypothetical protein n=1 Tax=Shinella daejeonensis TaxID=659017 RepID=UPI0020C7961F|nr:hypothetical protein [Shinella daejeonensis]
MALTLRGRNSGSAAGPPPSIRIALSQMTARSLARGKRQVQACIRKEGGRSFRNIAAAQPEVKQFPIGKLVQPPDRATIRPCAGQSGYSMTGAGGKTRQRTLRCETVKGWGTVDHAHGVSPFRAARNVDRRRVHAEPRYGFVGLKTKGRVCLPTPDQGNLTENH